MKKITIFQLLLLLLFFNYKLLIIFLCLYPIFLLRPINCSRGENIELDARLGYMFETVKQGTQKQRTWVWSPVLIKKPGALGLEGSSVAKSAGCSSREPGLISNPHDSLQLSVTPIPEDLRPSLISAGIRHQSVHRYTFSQNTHIHIINIFFKSNGIHVWSHQWGAGGGREIPGASWPANLAESAYPTSVRPCWEWENVVFSWGLTFEG